MLNPSHPTKVPTLERALAALGRRAEIEINRVSPPPVRSAGKALQSEASTSRPANQETQRFRRGRQGTAQDKHNMSRAAQWGVGTFWWFEDYYVSVGPCVTQMGQVFATT